MMRSFGRPSDGAAAAEGTRAAVACALRLALGKPLARDARAHWELVLATAASELLAPLAWARSGAFIRLHADAPVTAAWRRSALATHLRGEQQLAHLMSVLEALDAAGVDAVVLKGLPLGERLYGDPFVRCSADIDLFVPVMQRARAADALGSLGWRHADGRAPWHEAWSMRCGDGEHHVELHSSLVSDHLAHLPVPLPPANMERVADVSTRAHCGSTVAPYLATHLATHQMPPLLWLIDFATLWQALSREERRDADAVARESRLSGYLTWARERSALVERAAADDADALRALGFGGSVRRDIHSIWRHLVLAASPRDVASVAAAFVVPRRARGDVGTFWRYTVARLRTRMTSLAGESRRYASSTQGPHVVGADGANRGALRPLRVDRADMLALTCDVVREGRALRVRAPGGSMLPTIPRGALVRIGPVPPWGIARGDVVLALTSDGEPVIHRAVAVHSDRVVTRGDAALSDDPPIPLTRVIGVATHVGDGTSERPLELRPSRSIVITALKLRRRIARVVRRGR